jgi:hypothetical protein
MLVSQVLPEAVLVKLPFTIQIIIHKLPLVNTSFSEMYSSMTWARVLNPFWEGLEQIKEGRNILPLDSLHLPQEALISHD